MPEDKFSSEGSRRNDSYDDTVWDLGKNHNKKITTVNDSLTTTISWK